MSKPKPKDKKNDVHAIIERQFQAQKRDVIDYEFTIKQLQQRLAEKTLENEQLRKELEQMHMVDKEKIQILMERTEDDEKRLTAQIHKITQLEINATGYESMIKSLSMELMNQREARQKESTEFNIRLNNEVARSRFEVDNLKMYAENREKNEQELLNLKERLEYERQEKIRQLADKEREKVQATDKLRDEMLKKIRQMRTNLLSLKKEQLSTTTRLTILQNHQLTSELEYQSKQTEKLISKQEQMEQKIKQLTQELAIHKQVEEELAKRAHFSKGVIKKLSDRVAELERKPDGAKDTKIFPSGKSLSENVTLNNKPKNYIEQDHATKQLLVQVQSQLEGVEKKYSQTLAKLQASEKQRNNIATQLRKYENCCNQLAQILISYTERLASKENSQLEKSESSIIEPVLKINLEELRKKKAEDWSSEETSFVVKALLNLIKPYLTKKNIMIPAIKKLLVVEDSKLGKSDPRLPKISESDENASRGIKELPVNIASKIVGSNLREWGSTVRLTPQSSQSSLLRKKYVVSQSHRA